MEIGYLAECLDGKRGDRQRGHARMELLHLLWDYALTDHSRAAWQWIRIEVSGQFVGEGHRRLSGQALFLYHNMGLLRDGKVPEISIVKVVSL